MSWHQTCLQEHKVWKENNQTVVIDYNKVGPLVVLNEAVCCGSITSTPEGGAGVCVEVEPSQGMGTLVAPQSTR